jgi:hypothetical protein
LSLPEEDHRESSEKRLGFTVSAMTKYQTHEMSLFRAFLEANRPEQRAWEAPAFWTVCTQMNCISSVAFLWAKRNGGCTSSAL